ncbi:hypothetical protein [Capnocytophaga sp. oral taxon 338]|jgi:hypothetical protein|uniref:hypothetical protein n=1 Tax=Capnocytophaga sp. oral taxon 338 TaxID=710239 RepID=UPI000202F110|nr:hypothetical protein [Capnocytophaga sp. oral taxon 338]EGD34715.1 hypothetical protein HMPREF9071_0637 [Capnocytophaga sp. oral taxon 338 str. F0234]DAP42856.1 MAG TPA: hypothetical protein [Caudoviricetes sp.]
MFFFVSLILLFYSGEKIALRDRLYYLVITLVHSTPLVFVGSYFSAWLQLHEPFLLGIGVALFLNMAVGALYHLHQHSFNLWQFLYKNAKMMAVISVVYILLALLNVPLAKTASGELFESTIELMTLLYPVSKAIKHIFILTHGKYPPQWIIKALYNYEKEGKLKEFFNMNNEKMKSE